MLVVDHATSRRDGDCERLREAGYRIEAAAGVDEAIQAARRCAPDAILAELFLHPGGGYALCATLRKEPSLGRVPVVLLSSGPFRDHDFARRMGAGALVTRTADLSDALAALAECLDRARREGPAPIPSAAAEPIARDESAPEGDPPLVAANLDGFEIVRALSQGGMADLLLARERTAVGVERTVILKRLRLLHRFDPELEAMFLDEARLALRLEHSNIVRTYAVGERDGALCIAFEYLRGVDVRQIHQMATSIKVPIDLESVLTIGIQVASALAYAHALTDEPGVSLGIVHRDVSPSNIFVEATGNTKLLDFGVATARERVAPSTPRGMVKGTFWYMAPEQCQGRAVDARADLFSLGVVLFELLTGQQLFHGASGAEVAHNVLHAEIPLPSSLRPSLPPALDRLLLKALSRDVKARHQTSVALALDLEGVARQLGLLPGPRSLARFVARMSGEYERRRGRLETAPPAADSSGECHTAVIKSPTTGRTVVLVVDDDDGFQRTIRHTLAAVDRLVAFNAAQALDALASNRVDLVLLDLNLPDRSGLEVLIEIRNRWQDIPVIVCTVSDDLATALQCMKCGAIDFLTKRHSGYSELPHIVERAVNQRARAAASANRTAPGVTPEP